MSDAPFGGDDAGSERGVVERLDRLEAKQKELVRRLAHSQAYSAAQLEDLLDD